MKLIDEHHLQQRPVFSMIMGKEIVATHYNFTASVIFHVLTFGLFLCRPNVQTDREGLVQLNVFLQIPEYSLTTRLAVHPNASELVNTSKIETLTIGAIVIDSRRCRKKSRVVLQRANIVDVRKFRAEISVYDSGDNASFVLLGDAGTERTKDKLLTYSTITWEANGELVGEEEVPTPQCLVDASGQSHKFRVKVIP
ncbi:hypothetical protein F2Q70_00043916 [Brassica cretica]|uniref:Uncharacterized protein n=1 Tax=Brassica cretica TaxID=69181 RepID=A0A8S9KIC0_BRACR|nr:hypothetical protein F2Q70_00043916 [Brassica cretica]